MTERKSLATLADELSEASNRWNGSKIIHHASGDKYQIVGVHHRESDMAICVEYTPFGEFFNRAKFARSVEEMGFGKRFLFIGGPVRGNAELDGAAPNHFDPSKRGFSPR